MASRCSYCAGLSIRVLVDLAEKEFRTGRFPSQAFYQHHASIRDLEASSEAGCDLCRLILDHLHDASKTGGVQDDQSTGVALSPSGTARDLADSSVLMAINCDGAIPSVSHSQLNMDLTVFDEIMVQVGRPDKSQEAWRESQNITLHLSLTIPDDRPLYVENFRIGRFRVDPELSSDRNFSIARGWLQGCKEGHEGCLHDLTPVLPTRVVDVGTDPNFQDMCIAIPGGSRAEYVALSHCWGGRVSPLLTTDTLESFGRKLPYLELPANFRHAITITRGLGIRYIWIDCLCIIQDSKSDWEKEAKRMAHIYRDATVTVSALASCKSTDGILVSAPSSTSLDKPVVLHTSPDDPASREVVVAKASPLGEDLKTMTEESPLSKRGWCLQEALLSPRQLYYGKEQIYWHCPKGPQSALGVMNGQYFPSEQYHYIRSVFFAEILRQGPSLSDMRESTDDILEDYYALVEHYSRRKLTFGSDKLPAFSGITQRLQDVLDGEYLAGIWAGDLHQGLVWAGDGGTAEHVREYRAPSWSWAVTDQPVSFSQPMWSMREPGELDLQLVEQRLEFTDGSNPYGEVNGGYIRVRGLTRPMIYRPLKAESIVDFNREWVASFDDYGFWDESGDFMDDAFRVVDNDNEGLLLCGIDLEYQGQNCRITHPDTDAVSNEEFLAIRVYMEMSQESERSGAAWCLILRRQSGQEEEAYARVGLLDMREVDAACFSTWTSRMLVLV